MTERCEILRPKFAAARFGVDERTLARWARAGLIGRSQVDGTVWYVASDISELIASKLNRRTVTPIMAAMPSKPPLPADDWRSDPFWSESEGGR